MAKEFTLDTSDFDKKVKSYVLAIGKASIKACVDVAHEALRLSNFEVPHDLGLLQNSGKVEPRNDGALVGYNKVYAARLHEHPEYNFQKGRKGKYLEDPLINNMVLFQNIVGRELNMVSN